MAIDEIEDNFIDINKNRFVNIDKSYELKDNYKDITKDYKGAHKAKWEEKKNRTKTKENSVDHWNYGGQREYDFESLERKLLGWETA
ncbi:hypothetical protein [Clostridium sporogenes]|uniref:hypothetical protein n=1 Tax=Clostridium sporogenes TaxID=1509 RepID=UPI0006687F21|nr:hypothetical protein [Clostridium sporogenes]